MSCKVSQESLYSRLHTPPLRREKGLVNFGWIFILALWRVPTRPYKPWFWLVAMAAFACDYNHSSLYYLWVKQTLNLIGQWNWIVYTAIQQCCIPVVSLLSCDWARATISLACGNSSVQAQGFCPSLVPRPHHAREERIWGHCRYFLGLAHHHVTARAPIQTYANNHVIAELAEPRISANVPRPFPPLGVGSGDEINSAQLHQTLFLLGGGVWGRD